MSGGRSNDRRESILNLPYAVRPAFAVVVFLVSVLRLLEALYARRLLANLSDVTAPDATLGGARAPSLVAVIPVRNEQESLESAVRSVLAQDYPNLRVVLVNDRSEDKTGRIMERLAGENPGVRVLHVDRLPDGWIGKNHAIYLGARQLDSEWLLFTDADVRFDRTAFRRAVAFGESRRLDHLTLVPDLDLEGYWLNAFVAFFFMAFLVYRGRYKANIPSSRVGIGMGAFNLIRRDAYERIGTYEAVRLRPDDDLSLGLLVKGAGMRQYWLFGKGLLKVRWYSSFRELFAGVEKNVLAGLDYSLAKVIGYTMITLGVMLWPFAAILLVRERIARYLYLSSVAAHCATFVAANKSSDRRIFVWALGYPLCAALFAFMLVRSGAVPLLRGGVEWRGTFYPLSSLRKE
jgi:glycosyltransferase involved in cell wall biosynthesis